MAEICTIILLRKGEFYDNMLENRSMTDVTKKYTFL